jgi:hypothetical protein
MAGLDTTAIGIGELKKTRRDPAGFFASQQAATLALRAPIRSGRLNSPDDFVSEIVERSGAPVLLRPFSTVVLVGPDEYRAEVLMLLALGIHFRQNDFNLVVERQEPFVERKFFICSQ